MALARLELSCFCSKALWRTTLTGSDAALGGTATFAVPVRNFNTNVITLMNTSATTQYVTKGGAAGPCCVPFEFLIAGHVFTMSSNTCATASLSSMKLRWAGSRRSRSAIYIPELRRLRNIHGGTVYTYTVEMA